MKKIRFGAPLHHDPDPGLQWVEVSSSLQIPSFHIVGLPSVEISEARERIRAAIETSGFQFPKRRLVLNLSPASVRKHGTGLDLAMALAVLSAGGKSALNAGGRFARKRVSGLEEGNSGEKALSWIAWGELGLDGTVKKVGQLARAIYAAWKEGVAYLILPQEEYSEALTRLEIVREAGEFATPAPTLVAISSLREAWEAVTRAPEEILSPMSEASPPKELAVTYEDQGPEKSASWVSTGALMPLAPSLERMIGIAVAGSHHLLLLGPRGTGKSHAMEWLMELQLPGDPGVRLRQALLAELHSPWSALQRTPIRKIGTHARPAALLGNASQARIRPGEYSLAHGGVLIADEFPEWSRDSRESLREPLESGRITLTRVRGMVELPARFTLAATGNLCPCGGWPANLPLPPDSEAGMAEHVRCKCTPRSRELYLGRLSGPVLDRIDLVSWIGPAAPTAFSTEERAERLRLVRCKVSEARRRLLAIWGAPSGLLMPSRLEEILERNPSWRHGMEGIGGASLRSRHKILKVALTLAAWDETEAPTIAHFMEASCYRPERMKWGR